MQVKNFADKKITIRKITRADLGNPKKFQIFINALTKEDAKLLMNVKATLKNEKDFIERMLKGMKSKTRVYLVAESDGKMVGSTDIELGRYRKNHVGEFAIAISDGYRGIGLGTYLISEIIKLGKKELNP